MPTVLIEVRRPYTREQEMGLMDAVHAALRDAFKIKPGDRDIRLIVHEPHRFACPPACEKPEAFTLIGIDAFAGRSLDAKRNLYRATVARADRGRVGGAAVGLTLLVRRVDGHETGRVAEDGGVDLHARDVGVRR